MERRRLSKPKPSGGDYFSSRKENVDFIGSGSQLLDLALGGGWAERRIGNVVGDKSSGKTLLCIEASANFVRKYPKAKVRYRESESAFDPPYAEALGMPINKVDFGAPLETIEDMFEDMGKVIEGARGPELYIVDSLDALSDRAEMDRDMDEGTYGAEKAKKLSQLFRRTTSQLATANVTVLIVSQVRSKIGSMSRGRKTTRSGGRALDFYASQVLYLAQIGTISRSYSKVKRPVGIDVSAKVDKNKIALPYREAEFQIMFGYGVDDVGSCLDWLDGANALGMVDLDGLTIDKYLRAMAKMSDEEYLAARAKIYEAVEIKWYEVEKGLLPTRRKYA